MTAITVQTTSTIVVAPNSAIQWVDLHNQTAAVVYVAYDGSAASVANGFPLAQNEKLRLEGSQCKKGVYAIIAAATGDLRVQVG